VVSIACSALVCATMALALCSFSSRVFRTTDLVGLAMAASMLLCHVRGGGASEAQETRTYVTVPL
jgi:hypothetical protein